MGAKRKARIEGARIDLLVQPKASRSEILGFEGGLLRIRVCAAPSGGAANSECMALLARTLGIAKTRIHLIGGAAARRKRVIVEDMTHEEVEELVGDA